MDREKEWSLIIEDANTKLHLLLKASVLNEVNKTIIKEQVRNLITNVVNDLKVKEAPVDLIQKTEKSIMLRFVEWYNTITAMLLKEAKKNPIAKQVHLSITSNEPQKRKPIVIKINDVSFGTIDNVSDYVTTQTHAIGQSYMDDYIGVVKGAMKKIADKNLVMRDKNGRKYQ
jgi:hypothetical protein